MVEIDSAQQAGSGTIVRSAVAISHRTPAKCIEEKDHGV
jgi:hypothetical protein